jgi:hypothetical protein
VEVWWEGWGMRGEVIATLKVIVVISLPHLVSDNGTKALSQLLNIKHFVSHSLDERRERFEFRESTYTPLSLYRHAVEVEL